MSSTRARSVVSEGRASKPSAAGAILDEMEAERASKLESFLSGANGGEKKSRCGSFCR